MDISVAVCTYNRANTLRRVAESILTQDTKGQFTYELVIVNDGASDNTDEVVKSLMESRPPGGVPIVYVRQEGSGVAGARNVGIHAASGEWVLFFDDDQWTEPNWLYEMFKVAQEHKADCVTGALDLELPPSADMTYSPFCRDLLGETVELPDQPAEYSPHSVPPTANVMVHRTVFDRVGIFDANLRHGGSDVDFFWRARKAGATIWCAPGALGHHIVPAPRLEREYFRYLSLRCALGAARVRYLYRGRTKWFSKLVRTVLLALGRDVWLYAVARLRHDHTAELDLRCKLWWAWGYVRASFSFFNPRSQSGFLSNVHFRSRGRGEQAAQEGAANGEVRY